MHNRSAPLVLISGLGWLSGCTDGANANSSQQEPAVSLSTDTATSPSSPPFAPPSSSQRGNTESSGATSGTGATSAVSEAVGGDASLVSAEAGRGDADVTTAADVLDAGQPAFHLGRPFEIVDGVISAGSNDYGLEASFFTNRDPSEPPIELISLDDEVCVRGEVSKAYVGDVDKYWGIVLGFIVANGNDVQLTPSSLSISPEGEYWDFQRRGVIGLAFTVSGEKLPNSEHFGTNATPAGQDPGGQHGVGQELTVYNDCKAPAVSTSGQLQLSFFAELENYWCVEGQKAPWGGDGVVAFWWGISSVVVDEPSDADAAALGVDPYDFCLREIRPILAGPDPEAN